jgi:tRNA threonylcarbamoyladenosine biosynthesis protein TsaE
MSAMSPDRMYDPPETAPARQSVALRLRSLRDTARLGRALAQVLTPGELLLLEGSLGAGKTCLVRFIVRALGVPADQPVTSPTFEILHEFRGRSPIVHADLYRLDPREPLEELGLLERIGGDAVVLVEWGERFAAQLGDAGLRVTLELGAGPERRCELCARGARGQKVIDRLIPLLSAAGLPPF